jgi:hypothetical protein
MWSHVWSSVTRPSRTARALYRTRSTGVIYGSRATGRFAGLARSRRNNQGESTRGWESESSSLADTTNCNFRVGEEYGARHTTLAHAVPYESSEVICHLIMTVLYVYHIRIIREARPSWPSPQVNAPCHDTSLSSSRIPSS